MPAAPELPAAPATAPPRWSRRDYLRFLVPSAFGVSMFMVPMPVGESVNIGMGILADLASGWLGGRLPMLATLAVCVSAALTVGFRALASGSDSAGARPWRAVFDVGLATSTLRLVAGCLACLVLLQLGPEWLVSERTGGVILTDLMPVIFVIFVVASILLPFLTDFGLMELIGTLLRGVFRTVFRLPGRASIDAVASWMGSAPVGVLITTLQYERGFYTAREAATIATNFSVVSLAFAIIIINYVGLGHLFLPYYATIVVGGTIAAVVVPRLPPLSWKPDEYYAPAGRQLLEEAPEGRALVSWAVERAVARAQRAPGPVTLLRGMALTVLDIWFGLLPMVMVIGTTALVLAEHTPIFRWLATPLVPFLEVLGIPGAEAAAPAMLVGFADQFLPAILGQSLESELTRFVVACTSVTQLIYMSELGALLLRSKIPISVTELFAIFLLRTVITVPVAAGAAHLVF